MKRPPLRSLSAFEAAARQGSFSEAAKELGISTSAVSHQIKSLESFFGTNLFIRLSRGVKLTKEGGTFYTSVHEAYQRIDDGTQHMLLRTRNQVLTVRCGVSFGLRWLTPRLPLFFSEHPDFDLQIVTPIVDSPTPPIDLEIHYGPVSQTNVHVEPLPEENVVPLCSPALLKSGEALQTPIDLARFRLIESVVTEVPWSHWLSVHRVPISGFSRVGFDNILLALQAAVSGIGIALEGDFLASEDLASGRLVVPPALRALKIRKSLRSLVIPGRQAPAEKALLFRDWLFRNLPEH
ncbi:MAG: LysR family transcriptional regulator [Proteobacteria bacterium]|nr:LysR family transcriptional regulator [Pseudomonadota bacterium]